LITPIFLLRDIAIHENKPFKQLESAFNNIASFPSKSTFSEYEYQIKMFSAIFKSALRDQIKYISLTAQNGGKLELFDNLIQDVKQILIKYRSLSKIIETPTVSKEYYNFYEFGDEFMSNIVEQQFYELLLIVDYQENDLASQLKSAIRKIIDEEILHKKEQGYPYISKDSKEKNRDLVFRRGVLKKFIESDLFLTAKKKKDGILIEQIYFSLAAGVSMIFATVVAFSFQMKFGNFTMPFFVALVVSYMLKDRIKELMRYYFAHKRRAKYFDNKITVSIKENVIGWSKEGFDFISEKNVPREVMNVRNRSALLEADNRYTKEKIILYRKLLQVDRQKLDENSNYYVAGINEILRFTVSSFLNKMDNPEVPLYITNSNGEVEKILGETVYYLNFIIQLKYEDFEEYKRYRVILNRKGIMEVNELK
jgi:hypothetical protein